MTIRNKGVEWLDDGKSEKGKLAVITKNGELITLTFKTGIYVLVLDEASVERLHDDLIFSDFHEAVCMLRSKAAGGILQFTEADNASN